MTHANLVDIAYKWLIKNNYGFAFKELKSYTSEIPDAIGFKNWYSTLIEVKVSRSDFLADKKKKHKKGAGMGTFRFYMCPTDLIKIEDLPENWGLIYVNEKGKTRMIHNPYCKNINGNVWSNGFEVDMRAERCLFYTALRRLHLRGRIPEIYNTQTE